VITVVHAFPFFVRAYEQQSLGREWNANKAWWTGIASFFVLVWIFISSLIPIRLVLYQKLTDCRRLSYEFFVFQHIVSAIAYLFFIFLHTRDLFTSWIYLWASVALYGGSILIRTLISVWWTLVTTEAEVTTLVDDAVSVQIPVPTTKGQWKAGQHVFVRFPAIAPFQSHPFTIASIEENAELTLIIQKHSGFTKKLYDRVKENGPWKTRVVIDGPYGGPPRDPGSFDTVVLVAGGAGVTFTMPIMKDLVRRMQDLGKLRCSKLIFIWSVKKESTLEWLDEEIDQCTMGAEDIVQAKLYVTRSNEYEKDMPMLVSNATIDYMRPPLRKLLERAVEENRGRMCVLGAGPESMTSNLSTEVAVLQKRVMDGRSGEIFLHVESFG
jgi:predicted ferric reductase